LTGNSPLHVSPRTGIVLRHLLGWVSLLVFVVLFFPHPGSGSGFAIGTYILNSLPALILIIALFYFNYHVLVPKFFLTKRIGIYILIIIAIGVAVVVLEELTSEHQFRPPHLNRPGNFGPPRKPPGIAPLPFPVMIMLVSYLLVIAVSAIMRLLSEQQKQQQKMEAIAHEKTTAELNTLKAQINPHFLFNALNSIYGLSTTKSPNTPDAVLRLSDMLRYSTTQLENNTVALQQELDYLSNFISFQQLRLTPNNHVVFTVTGNAADKQIAPLLLIPFVENVFKFGTTTETDTELVIALEIENNVLRLTTRNQIFKDSNLASEKIGLENTQRRLNLLYPNRHRIAYTEANHIFEFSLELTLA
jgi:Histidine kinase